MNDGSIAYFSMEMALRPDMPTYSGGLGVLAGDTIRSAADLKLPMVAVTLVHRQGYFAQKLGQVVLPAFYQQRDDWRRECQTRKVCYP